MQARIWGLSGVLVLVAGATAVAASGAPRAPVRAKSAARPAANSATFTDPTGDNPPGTPDIAAVQAANDENGRIELRIGMPNRQELVEGDSISVYLDTDENAATGCDVGGFGIDWSLGVLGHTAPDDDFANLLRWPTGSFVSGQCHPDLKTLQGSYTGTFDAATSTLILRLSMGDIGSPSGFRFIVLASGAGNSGVFDQAGTDTPWEYPFLLSPDVTPPTVRTFTSTGARGGKAKLSYRAYDLRGATREQIAIYRGKTLLARTTTKAFAPSIANETHYVVWPVPRTAPSRLSFCVQAWDPTGNKSKRSCSKLTIR